jgi:hypothetical protein
VSGGCDIEVTKLQKIAGRSLNAKTPVEKPYWWTPNQWVDRQKWQKSACNSPATRKESMGKVGGKRAFKPQKWAF